jgi:hypothetical protein
MKKVVFNLVGQDGNAFALMGGWSKAARRQGWKKEEIDTVLNKCMKGGYEELLAVLVDVCEDEDDGVNDLESEYS